MDDNTSPAPADTQETPAPDSVLDVLNDTEDTGVDAAPADEKPVVDETSEEPEQQETETAEAEPEAETQPEATEDLQPEVDPKEVARQRYEERQRAKAETMQRIDEQTQDYVKEGEDEYDQRLRAMEVQQYKAQVENTQNTLLSEFERAKANPDLQIFNPDNKDAFNEKAYNKIMRDYNAGYVQYDQNGNMVGTRGSLYEHLTEAADLLKDSVKTGAVQQVRATRSMRSNADSKPAATPRATQKDPIMEILLADD